MDRSITKWEIKMLKKKNRPRKYLNRIYRCGEFHIPKAELIASGDRMRQGRGGRWHLFGASIEI